MVTRTAADFVKLQGAGASFPAPLYLKWFKAYGGAHKNVQINYQSVGSGSGVKSFIDKTVDFGASDAAMTPEEIAKVQGGVLCLPMTAGSIVIAYNVQGVPDLKLSTEGICRHLSSARSRNGTIRLSPRQTPARSFPMLRSTSSRAPTPAARPIVFTKHLSAISPEFAKSPGANKMPNWPVGTRSKGNEGVTAAVKTTPDSIGYVEYGYAKSQKLAVGDVGEQGGRIHGATTASGQAALASAQLPADLIAWASDPAGKDAYPIVTYTWLLLYKQYPDKKKADVLKDLLAYCLKDGQKDAEPLGYIPLPPDGERRS